MAEVIKITIKARQMIKPAEKTCTGTMKLSVIDMANAMGFVPKLYVYRPNKEWDPSSIAQTLKDSLAKALVHFYPFVGRLWPTEGGRSELVVDDSDVATWGVPLVEAEADVELGDDLAEAEASGSFASLFSTVDYGKPLQEMPLLMVQLTHFRCGGVAVAITWSHAVVDGLGAGHFYSEWTRLARGEPLGMKPLHDRTLLRAGEPPRTIPKFIQLETAPSANSAGVDAPPPFLKTTTTLKLPVSKSQIDKLKLIAGDGINGRPYSRFEVLTAHAWRCASKARGHEGKKLNALGIAIDIRKRVNPPLPRAFNGNGALVMAATSVSGDLVSNPLGYTCGIIRQTIDKVTDELVWAYLDYKKSVEDLSLWQGIMTPEGCFINPDVLTASWLNLPLSNLDFGWGNEAHMALAPQPLEGVVCLQEGREEGSAFVVVCLQVAHVDNFKECFFLGLE